MSSRQSRSQIDRDLDRILTALRNRIRERGYTQMEVQEALGWGRSYISQLLTRQKTLRFEQILQILNVIHLDPAEFWDEIYQVGDTFSPAKPRRRRAPAPARFPDGDDLAIAPETRACSSSFWPNPSVPGAHCHRRSEISYAQHAPSGLRRIRLLYDGIVRVLTQKNLITTAALEAAIARAEKQQG